MSTSRLQPDAVTIKGMIVSFPEKGIQMKFKRKQTDTQEVHIDVNLPEGYMVAQDYVDLHVWYAFYDGSMIARSLNDPCTFDSEQKAREFCVLHSHRKTDGPYTGQQLSDMRREQRRKQEYEG